MTVDAVNFIRHSGSYSVNEETQRCSHSRRDVLVRIIGYGAKRTSPEGTNWIRYGFTCFHRLGDSQRIRG